MAHGYTHHGYIIDFKEAKDLGLVVAKPKAKEWDLIWKIYLGAAQEGEVMAIIRALNEFEALQKIGRGKI